LYLLDLPKLRNLQRHRLRLHPLPRRFLVGMLQAISSRFEKKETMKEGLTSQLGQLGFHQLVCVAGLIQLRVSVCAPRIAVVDFSISSRFVVNHDGFRGTSFLFNGEDKLIRGKVSASDSDNDDTKDSHRTRGGTGRIEVLELLA